MTLAVLLAVLGAAFLHALWNALIRVGTSRIGAMVILSVMEIPVGLAVVLMRPLPPAEVIPWVLAAGVAHFGYKFFLAHAYEVGDLSRVYPIARGAAPMIAAIAGLFLLADAVRPIEYIGIAVLGLGILTMARGVFTDGESRRLLPYALGSALATASYTLIDGMGARVSGDAIAYVGWIYVVDGILFATGMVALKGRSMLGGGGRAWAMGTAASVASYGAYAISVWAMTVAPIALVAALRETSILFAVLIGWLVFGERMTPNKALAAALIVGGVILTRL
ncbi:DMT family transporter [Gemmobacter sp.]|uniref:DMT family transporter n=1 Tax=Gemmobacter sp. TaxID=1898957 RepID=UPI002AFE96F8|nr:DMT family transporter [Gemmobacter sp.]